MLIIVENRKNEGGHGGEDELHKKAGCKHRGCRLSTQKHRNAEQQRGLGGGNAKIYKSKPDGDAAPPAGEDHDDDQADRVDGFYEHQEHGQHRAALRLFGEYIRAHQAVKDREDIGAECKEKVGAVWFHGGSSFVVLNVSF